MALKIASGGFSERQARQTQCQQKLHSEQHSERAHPVPACKRVRARTLRVGHVYIHIKKTFVQSGILYALALEAPEELLALTFWCHHNFLCTPLLQLTV